MPVKAEEGASMLARSFPMVCRKLEAHPVGASPPPFSRLRLHRLPPSPIVAQLKTWISSLPGRAVAHHSRDWSRRVRRLDVIVRGTQHIRTSAAIWRSSMASRNRHSARVTLPLSISSIRSLTLIMRQSSTVTQKRMRLGGDRRKQRSRSITMRSDSAFQQGDFVGL